MSQKITQFFKKLKEEGKKARITFTMAGDPNIKESENILMSLPDNGVDIVELGMPFSDPTADGPAIQAAGIRALQSEIKVSDIFNISNNFSKKHPSKPLILMGYYNPIFRYGAERFANDAAKAGVDGVIIVDLPPEEEGELVPYLNDNDIAMIRLIAPTTRGKRLKEILKNCKGFVYCIAVKGTTGGKSADYNELESHIKEIREHTDLPVVVGFGIKNKDDVKALENIADGTVVGSALVDKLHNEGKDNALKFINNIFKAGG